MNLCKTLTANPVIGVSCPVFPELQLIPGHTPHTAGLPPASWYLLCEHVCIHDIHNLLVRARQVGAHLLHQPLLPRHTRVAVTVLAEERPHRIRICCYPCAYAQAINRYVHQFF